MNFEYNMKFSGGDIIDKKNSVLGEIQELYTNIHHYSPKSSILFC